ncbi:hypothetical protein [Flavobacterium lindanitolerans]|jgi:hypothetical protein|uniref:hypothetical protein n=1 Tax=Flavobacterium lindanitolerans TaxID=428988 RepID=UPI0023F20552|nr:hypothetical protein [Flavobacterium lindanitolerans]
MAFFSSERLDDRKDGLKKIKELKDKKSRTIVIHYSCESFFNIHGRTPRVTSIAVRNRDNLTTTIFSIHLSAQFKKKNPNNLTDQEFDLVEKDMLKDFFEYLKKHQSYCWVHWNMRNANFGFEAINNRYKILDGNPKIIEDQFRYDLPEILGLIHTYDFEKHDKPNQGQLLNLAKRNKINSRDALKGADEAIAFDNRDFLKLHMSTIRKVEIIDRILTLQDKKKLKVNALLIKSCGLTPAGIIEIVRNNWILFSFWSLIMAIIGMAMEPIVQNFFGTNK